MTVIKTNRDLDARSITRDITPSIFAKSMALYLQAVGHFFAKENYYTERHKLNSYLLVYTCAGRGFLNYRNKTYVLQEGDIFFIDCGDLHIYDTNKSALWEIQYVHFNGPGSRTYFELMMNNNGPTFHLPDDSPVLPWMEELLQLVIKKDKRIDIISQKLLVNILSELLLPSFDQGNSKRFMPESILKVIELIESNYARPVPLEELAKNIHVSKFQLIREFKKYTGYSPHEYIINFRLSTAKTKLKLTELPISDIAKDCGFDNVSHFISLFKKHESMTPLVYRKQWRQF